MRRRLPTLALVVAFLLAVSRSASVQGQGGRPEGLITKEQTASAGYTLYSPLEMERTYLVDLDGKVAHTFRSPPRTRKCRPGAMLASDALAL